MEDLTKKTNEELREIMRNSIDNQYVPTSIYHKAKQELEFREARRREKERILKLSPEFHGIGINLRVIWRRIRERLSRG